MDVSRRLISFTESVTRTRPEWNLSKTDFVVHFSCVNGNLTGAEILRALNDKPSTGLFTIVGEPFDVDNPIPGAQNAKYLYVVLRTSSAPETCTELENRGFRVHDAIPVIKQIKDNNRKRYFVPDLLNIYFESSQNILPECLGDYEGSFLDHRKQLLVIHVPMKSAKNVIDLASEMKQLPGVAHVGPVELYLDCLA